MGIIYLSDSYLHHTHLELVCIEFQPFNAWPASSDLSKLAIEKKN
jgi:hypothetical protein